MSDADAMMVDAVLPAGGRLTGEFAATTGVEIKALLEMGGTTVLQRTIDTLRATGRVRRVVVVGPQELSQHPAANGANACVAEGATSPENILRGIEWLHAQDGGATARTLVVTTDLPFLTTGGVGQFIDACPAEKAIAVPVYQRPDFATAFPDLPGEYVRLRDGEWTAGCVYLIDPAALQNNRAHLDRIFAARKSQLAMARLLGPLFVLRYVMKRLTTGHIRTRCEQLLGCSGAMVTGCAPELAVDIDGLEDYRYACRHLKA